MIVIPSSCGTIYQCDVGLERGDDENRAMVPIAGIAGAELGSVENLSFSPIEPWVAFVMSSPSSPPSDPVIGNPDVLAEEVAGAAPGHLFRFKTWKRDE